MAADINLDIELKINQAEKNLALLKKELKELNAQLNDLDGDTEDYQKTLTEIGKKKADINALSKSVTDLKKAFSKKEPEAFDDQIKEINKDLDQTTKELRDIEEATKNIKINPKVNEDLKTFKNELAESAQSLLGPIKEGFAIGFGVRAFELALDTVRELGTALVENIALTKELNRQFILLGDSTEEAKNNSTILLATARSTGKDVKDLFEATSQAARSFGISGSEAAKLISEANTGLLKDNKQFEQQFTNNITILKSFGFTLQEVNQIFEAFSQQGIDLSLVESSFTNLKDGLLNNSEEIKFALTNAFGAAFTQKLVSDFQSGKISLEKAVEDIAVKYNELRQTTNLSVINQEQFNQIFGTKSPQELDKYFQAIQRANDGTIQYTDAQLKQIEKNKEIDASSKQLQSSIQQLTDIFTINSNSLATLNRLGSAALDVISNIVNFVKNIGIEAFIAFATAIASVKLGVIQLELTYQQLFGSTEKVVKLQQEQALVDQNLNDLIISLTNTTKESTEATNKDSEAKAVNTKVTGTLNKQTEDLTKSIQKYKDEIALINAAKISEQAAAIEKVNQEIKNLENDPAFKSLTSGDQTILINAKFEPIQKNDAERLKAFQDEANRLEKEIEAIEIDIKPSTNIEEILQKDVEILQTKLDGIITDINNSKDDADIKVLKIQKAQLETQKQVNAAFDKYQVSKDAQLIGLNKELDLNNKIKLAKDQIDGTIVKEFQIQLETFRIQKETNNKEIERLKTLEQTQDVLNQIKQLELENLGIDLKVKEISAANTELKTTLGILSQFASEASKLPGIAGNIGSIFGSLTTAIQTFNNAGATTGDKIAAGLQAAGAIAQQVGNILNQISQDRIARLEEEKQATQEAIEANNTAIQTLESRRDKASQDEKKRIDESINKLKAANAQKLQSEKQTEDAIAAEKKKAANVQKAISITQAIINGAVAITQAFAQLGPVAGAIAAAVIAAITATQVAVIASQKFAKGGIVKAEEGKLLKGPSHSQGGIPIEAEGGEIILNKRVAQDPRKLAIANYLNTSTGGKPLYKYGGMVPKAQSGLLVPKMPTLNLSTTDTTNKELLAKFDKLIAVAATPNQVAVTEINEVGIQVQEIESRNRF